MKPFPKGCRLSKVINLGVFDVYNVVGEIQKILQFVNILPHEKFDKFNELLDILVSMSDNINVDTCICDVPSENMEEENNSADDIEEDDGPKIKLKVPKKGQCLWPYLHYAKRSLKSDQFKGLSIFILFIKTCIIEYLFFFKYAFVASVYICGYISKMNLFPHILMS